MADPFGIIGVIGVAAQFMKLSLNFGLDWKDAPDDIKSFMTELQTLKTTLSEVNTNIIMNPDFIDAFEGRHSTISSLIGHNSSTSDTKTMIAACKRELETSLKDFERRVSGHRLGWERLRSTFLSKRTREIVQSLTRQCQLLNNLVAIDSAALEATILREVREGRTEQHTRAEIENRKAILDWISPINFAAQHHDYAHRRQAGTGQWLLDSGEFAEWLAAERSSFLCQGIPGVGKTILMATVVDELSQRFSKADNVGIAYVYCNFQRHAEQKAHGLLASILRQLTQILSPIPDEIMQLYDSCEKKCPGSGLPSAALSRALRSVCDSYARVFILVDALDECQIGIDGRMGFLDELFSLQASHRLNIFATSRLIPEITDRFSGCISRTVKATEDDIVTYLDGHMVQLPSFVVQRPELQEDVKNTIVEAADGIFLLAKLHLESLIGKRSPKALRNTLAKLPTGSDAYDRAYQSAMERIERQTPDQEELAKQVLSWILCAKRPLRTEQLQQALAVEVDDDELDQENMPQADDMISVCVGLITIDKESDVVRMVHKTTEEYFQRTRDRWFPEAEADITITCITVLFFGDFLTRFLDIFLEDTDLMTIIWNRLSTRVRLGLHFYAAENWILHAGLASTKADAFVSRFIDTRPEALAKYYQWAIIETKRHMLAWLFARIPDVNVGDGNGRPPLHHAVLGEWSEGVELLLKRGADGTLLDAEGASPLHYTVRAGKETDIQLAKLLLDAGVPVDTASRLGFTTLHSAVWKGSPEMVDFLVRSGADPAVESQNGITPLLCTALREKYRDGGSRRQGASLDKSHSRILGSLLNHPSADCNTQDQNGNTPLHLLPYSLNCDLALSQLLNHGARPCLKNAAGETALHIAAGNANSSAVVRLLEHGAKVGDCNFEGRNALHYAASKGNIKLLQILLEQGSESDIKAKDKHGRGIFHYFLADTWDFGQSDLDALLSAQLGINEVDNHGDTPLGWGLRRRGSKEGRTGSSRDDLELISALGLFFKMGADPRARNHAGQNLAHIYAQGCNPHPKVFEFLAKNGVNLQETDKLGLTILHYLSMNQDDVPAEIIDEICNETGLAVDQADHIGKTPADYARERCGWRHKDRRRISPVEEDGHLSSSGNRDTNDD